MLGLGIVLLGFTAGTFFGVVIDTQGESVLPGAPPPPTSASRPQLAAIRAGVDLVPGGTIRRVFTYSVVPGGVYSAAEAEGAAETDPVVADHYQDLVLPAMFTRQVAAPRAVHVSYRVGDRVYWTKNKVLLHAGEGVLTDGINEVRARCGNRISAVPQAPVLPVEPPLEELVLPATDDLLPPPPLLASREVPTPVIPETQIVAPGDPPAFPRVVPAMPPVPPHNTVVPEPTTVLLVGSGLAALVVRRLRRDRR